MKREEDRMCFACGQDNPISLQLNFKKVDQQQVAAEFIPAEVHQGYNQMMHGGLVSTLLDEAMVKAVGLTKIKSVTAELKVRFKKPIPIGEKLIIYGKITEQRGRLFYTEGNLKNEEGQLLARAEGKFMTFK